MSKKESQSPYITSENRLADVIAAIQVMATYRFYKLDFKNWSMRISGSENNSAYWEAIFEEHSEFFRFNSDKSMVSLVWRRSKQRRYHVDLNKEIELDDINKLSKEDAKGRISRRPLSSSEIETLITTAMDLHSRAFEHKKDKRWWVVPLISAASGMIGVLIGTLLK